MRCTKKMLRKNKSKAKDDIKIPEQKEGSVLMKMFLLFPC